MLEALMVILVVLIGALSLIVAITLLRAFVLIQLWSWFVIPMFGLPILTIPFALGLSLIVGMFHPSLNPDTTDNNKNKTIIANAFLNPIFVLLIGWVIKTFIK